MKIDIRFFKVLVIFILTISCSKSEDPNEDPDSTQDQGSEIPEPSVDEKVYQGFVNLSSQNEVDKFGENQYDKINGGIMLIGNSIVNSDTLESIKHIEGNIHIIGTALENINGFKNAEVSHGIHIEVINNSDLTNIEGFQNFDANLESLTIRGNQSLSSITGVNNISKITYYLEVSDTESLTDLEPLSEIEFDLSYFTINDNKALSSIPHLKNITRIEDLSITNNNQLVSINSFDNLQESKSFSIYSNNILKSIDGFSNLKSASNITIKDNPKLENLNGLVSLEYLHDGYLRITTNTSLKDFCGLTLLSSSDISGFNIRDNLYNPTKEDIINGDCKKED